MVVRDQERPGRPSRRGTRLKYPAMQFARLENIRPVHQSLSVFHTDLLKFYTEATAYSRVRSPARQHNPYRTECTSPCTEPKARPAHATGDTLTVH